MIAWEDRVHVARRLMKKMTQKELAAKLGVSVSTICYWETGKCEPQKKQREALETLCGQHGVVFTPSGMPVPKDDMTSYS